MVQARIAGVLRRAGWGGREYLMQGMKDLGLRKRVVINVDPWAPVEIEASLAHPPRTGRGEFRMRVKIPYQSQPGA